MDIFDDDAGAGDPPIELEIWAEAEVARFVLDGAIWNRRTSIGRRCILRAATE